MRAVVQRVSSAQVTIDHQVAGQIARGLVILLGIQEGDTTADMVALADKIVALRIFADADDKMNLSLLDTHSQALIISQFTLLADTRKGNRPSFIAAAKPPEAIPLYEAFCDHMRQRGITVATGRFGADMQVQLTNDGPVTIVLDTRKKET